MTTKNVMPVEGRFGFDAAGREYPYWDNAIESMVYAHHGDWMVSVTPMLFNDRILLAHRDHYPLRWVAGFCYDKGGAAGLAAQIWNPLVTHEPLGYKEVAADERSVPSR